MFLECKILKRYCGYCNEGNYCHMRERSIARQKEACRESIAQRQVRKKHDIWLVLGYCRRGRIYGAVLRWWISYARTSSCPSLTHWYLVHFLVHNWCTCLYITETYQYLLHIFILHQRVDASLCTLLEKLNHFTVDSAAYIPKTNYACITYILKCMFKHYLVQEV